MSWTIQDSRDLYAVPKWGNGFFDINQSGHAVVNLRDGDSTVAVSIQEIIEKLRGKGRALPATLRFPDLLDRRIEHLNASFLKAIADFSYQGDYRGVYPIKVNQQQQVIEEISAFGRKYNHGLEAGSKPELIAALAYMHNPGALIVCNGYKDDEFIDLALLATRIGMKIIIVIEMPGEIPAIIDRSRALGIRPTLGVRFRLATKSEGHWAGSGGDRSVFGLDTSQLIDAVDLLKAEDFLNCLELFHYHQGSQLPKIQGIREAAAEAVRAYVNLAREGAPMGYLDMGGGLAIDYGGSHPKSPSSCDYTLEEYARDLVDIVQFHCNQAGLPHPDIITESGRAIVAYYSVLAFNILDVTRFEQPEPPPEPAANAHRTIRKLWEISRSIEPGNLQVTFNDATFYLKQLRDVFASGHLTLRERATGEKYYWYIATHIAHTVRSLTNISKELRQLEDNLTDFYYANFSVFQSLPDSWAIGQIFPIMPVHRLDEKPTRRAILADITCDCDGKLDHFIDRHKNVTNFLPLHDRAPNQEYNLAAFLVGAYQETLGDLHNLLGDPHVVSVTISDGKLDFHHEVAGDSVAEVLSYVEFKPDDLVTRFQNFTDSALANGTIDQAQHRQTLDAFHHGLHGYTYHGA